ncbi:MAG: EAL domain-containing protein [Anaerovoracaceae bacterium]
MKKQILIVEDNEINREMLHEILASEYQVLEAANGQEALDVLHQYRDSIALILLDVMMPVMDGYAFLDRMKEDAELALIPVIVMTQSDSEADEVAALVHGATDFVPKPYRPQVILHRVASLIKLRETAAMVNQFQYDRLTGLYSKEFFCQKVRERLQEDPEQDYCIVCSNIENFKLFNDIFGTKEGDRLLKEVADIAREMVGSTGFCGRFTADRILCFQQKEQEQKDRMNFGAFTEHEPSPLLKSVVMRWGIYEITDPSVPVEQMCDRALLAADSIKGQYNRYFAVYDDSLRSKLMREVEITESMERALNEGQFTVWFQPKYNLMEGCIAGAEALVRWNHPKWGMMSPGEFIPLFEKNGFIPRLDQYVWEQVCIWLRDWREKGNQILPVSVNVSRADVYQNRLLDILRSLTETYGIDPAFLHLEITETTYGENPRQLVSTVEQLREMGFIVEMDDFGSGYSSLNMLSQMNLDVLKLDIQFTQNEIAKSPELSILNDVINMAHRLGMSVVAEGIETREQMECLESVGCDYAQGYFLAKPMPTADFEKLLKRQPVQTGPSEADRQRRARRVENRMPGLLVVEEETEYREKVHQAFEGEYEILEAFDADSTLACIREHGSERISAVILSMTLPGDDTASIMNYFRQEPAFWHVPILATLPQCDVREELPLTLDADDFLCKCHPVLDLHRRVERMVGVASCQARECALREEANRDYMTELLNRRGLQAALASLRKEDLPLAVCIFDLDDLKTVNDTCGHHAGDHMIRTFAELLGRKTRSGDILCRYGGDEFVVILKRMPDEAIAKKKCEDICQSFREKLAAEGEAISCSAGVVLCSRDEMPLTLCIEYADRALYQAKEKNKGCCSVFQADGSEEK